MTIMSNFASSFVNFEIPNWFDSQHLTGMLRGIEKEGLRVKPDGFLAQTPHPAKLGSKLTPRPPEREWTDPSAFGAAS